MIEAKYYMVKYGEKQNSKNKGHKEKKSSTGRGANPSKDNKLFQILHALNTKPFLILAGVSGTGKTQIARIVAGVMAGKD